MKTLETKYGTFWLFEAEKAADLLKEDKVPDQDLLNEHLVPHLLNASTVITMGTSYGIIDMYMTLLKPSINIYSFEPRDKWFSILEHNLTQNGVENVIPINNLLGNRNGEVHVESQADDELDEDDLLHLIHTKGDVIGLNQNTMHMVTIDSLHLISCDLIYNNLEGCQYLVIAGALHTIQKFRPIICLRKNTNILSAKVSIIQSQGAKRDVKDLLQKLDYTIHTIDDTLILAIPNTQSIEDP
jgi:FkbM family methyltransferase